MNLQQVIKMAREQGCPEKEILEYEKLVKESIEVSKHNKRPLNEETFPYKKLPLIWWEEEGDYRCTELTPHVVP